jgi:hypothetical protein
MAGGAVHIIRQDVDEPEVVPHTLHIVSTIRRQHNGVAAVAGTGLSGA